MSIMDEKLRDFNRFTGDGLADEPVGAPLPIGDPRSGAFVPQKKDLREAFSGAIEGAETARGEAQGFADAANTSASTAATNANQASASATQAQLAAAAAGAIVIPARLGEIADVIDTLDLDDAIHNGWYRANAPANSPFTGWVSVNVYATDTNYVTQDCWKASQASDADSAMMRRVMASGTFGSWFKVVSTETEIKALAANTPALTGRLGETAYGSYTSNWDDADTNGWYSGLNATNAPLTGWVTGIVTAHKTDWIKQEVFGTTSSDVTGSNTWRRFKVNNAWGAWFQVFSTATEIKALAPIAGWHPYDMDTLGDGADGLIYDHAVDGAAAYVNTPVFEDGYEYLVSWEAVSWSSGSNLALRLHRETDSAYSTAYTVAGVSAAYTSNGHVHVILPRLPSIYHSIRLDSGSPNITGGGPASGTFRDATLQTIDWVRLDPDGNFDGGKLFMYRRREHITG